MQKWIQDNLSELLGFACPEDLAQSILKMENEKDVEEYLKTLLNTEDPKHRQFILELKKRRASCYGAPTTNKKANDVTQKATKRQNEKKKGKTREISTIQEVSKPVEKAEKKKSKFVNLYSQEGKDRQAVMLKGRRRCDCEARTHSLINNCLSCGRIVCAQEGAGPCLFCGSLVCTPDQQMVLSSNSKQADNLYNKLRDQKPVRVTEEAVRHRDKLLEYDRDSTKRTEVIDDECDYYQSSNNAWLSNTERDKLQKKEEEIRRKKYESRLTRKVTLDFAGRQVVEESEEDYHEALDQELRETAASMIARVPDDGNLCLSADFDRPWYVEMNILNSKKSSRPKKDESSSWHSRIQDKEYLEMSDEGVCLSLHQPYASLLVAGIKTHEGRNWYSSHRGRLWIAAAAAVPDTETISMLENRYRVLLNDNVRFPQHYPTSCLLGCVTVSDVLPSEEYRCRYPEGESDSPFVFICENCYELPLKFPMQGKHKMYKLDKKIHQAAMKTLANSLKVRGD